MANPIDQKFALVPETVAGTIPTTPAFLTFPNNMGNVLNLVYDDLTSSTVMPNRESAGNTKTNRRTTGTMKCHLQRDASVDVMLSSLMGSTWVSNVLKSGKTDSSYTLEKQFTEGGTTYYRQFKGTQTTKFSLTCEASTNAEATFEVLGMDATNGSNAAIASSTYAAASTSARLTGMQVSNVTVTGITGSFAKLSLSSEMPREAQQAFGSNAAVAIAPNGARKHTLSLSLYKRDYTSEAALLNDNPVAVSFDVGTTGNGYRFTFPAATCTVTDEDDASKIFVKLDFTAGYDATTGTAFMITRL